ncbi:Outer membrane protein assembly factor BamE [Rhodovastum atsumiense]|uniref:Outer membrane protein assembly factor BamE n=1 Tax=Rhodovastum atsumiense TaxID=504468 RepID=A0A5M6IQZ7_9PROT|nr:outer membrane protein assembly factor BamE [Rhodovastum atsumiense]KAA5610329.1 outer membrane protein assembly factor BamE [Rhodovastum atsumiense]CAH2600932.1 Outer membrane protein assembly factor BamE [Rhodovastum atsumiense]
MTLFHRLTVVAMVLSLAACTSASEHARNVAAGQDARDRLTVGTVQREIRQGMSGAEVAAALGSPNIVTSDERRRETWVYDRIATEQIYSNSSGGVNALFLAGVGGRSGAAQTSQRTLTIIIRFDENGRVRDFTYRSSSF